MTSANGFFVKVTATVESGICEPVTCVAEGCEVQVDREWDLPAGITMQFCTVRPPPQLPLCQFPPPTSGVGGPGSASANDTIRCGGYKVYTIETSSLSASTTGTCSQCS